MQKLIDWIVEHDNKKLFIVLYIGLSLVLSIAISLFWLLFAVLIHFFFEIIGQSRKIDGKGTILWGSIWETKLDFALVVFAFWLAIYLDFIFGVAGIGALARVGAQTASRAGSVGGKAAEVSVRFAAWNRVIRGIMLSIDDVGNAAKAIYQGKKAKKSNDTEEEDNYSKKDITITEKTPCNTVAWKDKWSVIDHIGVGVFAFCSISIFAAPWIINMSYGEIIQIALKEFHPFPN